MTARQIAARAAARLDRRGVALPLALLGLVVVSILVTTALLTSTTEAAISDAQKDATRSLYRADAAVEGYIASRAAALSGTNPQPLQRGTFAFSPQGGGTFSMGVARLQSTNAAHPTQANWRRITETYSITATPTDGRGRAVGALYSVTRDAPSGTLNINAGASIGANSIRIPGQAALLSGVDTSSCSTGNVAALELAAETDYSLRTSQVEGSIVRTTTSMANYGLRVLNNITPQQLAGIAEIKWGEALGGRAWSGFGTSSGTLSRSSGLNWGCPLNVGISSCNTDPDSSYYPVVAIQPPNGQTAALQGHGQGVLIVLGDARVNSNFVFKGVVIIAGDLRTNGGTNIYGALVGLGDITLDTTLRDGDDEDLTINGQALVKFDRCQLNKAQQSLANAGLTMAQQQFGGRTFAWFEVVR